MPRQTRVAREAADSAPPKETDTAADLRASVTPGNYERRERRAMPCGVTAMLAAAGIDLREILQARFGRIGGCSRQAL
jgi:hypothetical protein